MPRRCKQAQQEFGELGNEWEIRGYVHNGNVEVTLGGLKKKREREREREKGGKKRKRDAKPGM